MNFAKFCETKEDFNHIYGLSLEGIDPEVLTKKLISDIDWLSVYKVSNAKGKVKLKHVRTELYEDLRFHQKVHQEILVKNELSIAFGRAFAYKYCQKVKEETNTKLDRIAWVVAGEASIERCRKMGNLHQKMA